MSNFTVKRVDSDSFSTLQISGFLDAHTAPMLEKELQALIDEGQYNILIDFSDLSYISSAGLGVFMGFIELVRSHEGDIKMCRMNPKIYRVFDLLGFPTLYDIVDDQDTAVAKFNDGSRRGKE
jgi:anti-sigma B factor antagonist